jgi:hypothetical protein
MKAFVAIGALAALLALPSAMAVVSTDGILPAEFGTPVYYIVEDGSIWQESNSCIGLQTAAGVDEHCGEYGADTNVIPAFGAPEAPQLPGLPSLPPL